MILQLNPTIRVDTSLRKWDVIFSIDSGILQNTCWVVALAK